MVDLNFINPTVLCGQVCNGKHPCAVIQECTILEPSIYIFPKIWIKFLSFPNFHTTLVILALEFGLKATFPPVGCNSCPPHENSDHIFVIQIIYLVSSPAGFLMTSKSKVPSLQICTFLVEACSVCSVESGQYSREWNGWETETGLEFPQVGISFFVFCYCVPCSDPTLREHVRKCFPFLHSHPLILHKRIDIFNISLLSLLLANKSTVQEWSKYSEPDW